MANREIVEQGRSLTACVVCVRHRFNPREARS
jgi:hypothetical protein